MITTPSQKQAAGASSNKGRSVWLPLILTITLIALIAAHFVLAHLIWATEPPPRLNDADATIVRNSILWPAADLDNWACENYEKSSGYVTRQGIALVAHCTAGDGTDWHFQIHENGLDFTEGKQYTLVFSARSDTPDTMWVEAIVDQGDFHDIGLRVDVKLDRHWRTYRYMFTAKGVIRRHVMGPQFELGHHQKTVWLANIGLSPSGGRSGT